MAVICCVLIYGLETQATRLPGALLAAGCCPRHRPCDASSIPSASELMPPGAYRLLKATLRLVVARLVLALQEGMSMEGEWSVRAVRKIKTIVIYSTPLFTSDGCLAVKVHPAVTHAVTQALKRGMLMREREGLGA